MLSEFQQFDTQVLGASSAAAPAQRAFAEHCELQFPLVADFPSFAAAKAFGVFNEERLSDSRVTFVIDKDAVIQQVIDDPRDYETHANESLENIKHLP